MTKAELAEVKKYLDGYSSIKFQIGWREYEIQYIHNLVFSRDDEFTCLSEETRQIHREMIDTANRFMGKYAAEIKELEARLKDLVSVVDGIEDPEGRQAVRMHYLDGVAFSVIADRINLSERQLYRRLNKSVYPKVWSICRDHGKTGEGREDQRKAKGPQRIGTGNGCGAV